MAVVQFNKDAYPHCNGDIKVLSDKELVAVDKYCEEHDIADAYVLLDSPADSSAGDGAAQDGPSIQELRAQAKALGLSAGGSKADLQARIDEANEGSSEGDEEDSIEE